MAECGGCTECCTIMQVASLGKKRLERCRHVVGGGCAIYAARPAECATYACMWFASQEMPDAMPDAMRPDRSGVLVWSEPAPFGQAFADDGIAYLTWAEETRAGALEGYWARKMLNRLSRRLVIFPIRHGQLQFDSETAQILGPPALVADAERFLRERRGGIIL